MDPKKLFCILLLVSISSVAQLRTGPTGMPTAVGHLMHPEPITKIPVFRSKTAEIHIGRVNLAQRLFTLTTSVGPGVDPEIGPALYRCMAEQAKEISKFSETAGNAKPRRVYLLFLENFDQPSADVCKTVFATISDNVLQFNVCFDAFRADGCRVVRESELRDMAGVRQKNSQERLNAHAEFKKAMEALLEKISN